MSMFVLYGISALRLELASPLVESALGVVLESRNSSFSGDYYKSKLQSGESISLRYKTIYDRDEVYLAEPEFPGWNVFLYLDHANAVSSIAAKIEQRSDLFTKLRSKII